ncbi:tRNA (guanine(37)-N1)-methyltransferase isoform X5 [Anthonomus grandis grandis]|nr:tRNA (guanine(37)-N1)-methyltransferase isoform X5 [Anthonomus grandis grandis]
MNQILSPPEAVYLMQDLNKTAFEKTIKVPVITATNVKISSVIPPLKKLLFKIEKFKPIVNHADNKFSIYLTPEKVQKWEDLPQKDLESTNISESNLSMQDFTLKYENYTAEAILRAVLPRDKEGVSSFTKVGHIVHVNLREHLMPYKNLIGEVLFDKVQGCQSVVNKVNMIDNTFRHFKMEVLKGDSNMHTLLKENNCKFEFDFSTVYWNSRLCTEHERIVKSIGNDHVLFDVFAGVGPFAIPVAKKKSKVYANDLNPESYKWLMHNKKLNKISDEYFEGYNMDGRDFILTVLKENLPKHVGKQIVVTMNLPALAVEFLNSFVGLLKNSENISTLTVYVYCFTKGENPEQLARDLIHTNLKVKGVNVDEKIKEIFKVRTVSSMKEMMRVTLSLDKDILAGEVVTCKRSMEEESLVCKKICTEDKNGQKQEENQQCFQSDGSQESENEGQSESGKE